MRWYRGGRIQILAKELDLCSTNGFPLSWTHKLLSGFCNIMCNYWGWLSFFSGKYDCLDLLQILWKKMSFIWSRKRILPKSYLIVEKKLEKTQFVWTKRGSLYEGQTVLCEAQSVFIEYVDWEIIKALALPIAASPYLMYHFLFHRKQNIKNKSYLQLLSAVNLGHQNSLKS